MTKPRKRSDYRTDPRDVRYEGALSFAQYLTGPYTRQQDWTPDRPPSGLMRLHRSSPNGGVPKMRHAFLKWLDGEKDNVPGVKWEEVQRCIERARQDDPQAIAALELYQGVLRMSRVKFCLDHNIRSDSTITKWFYRAVALVVEYLCDEWGRGRRE